MKAVVMEIKGMKAITLSDNGTFTNIRNKGYSIGQSIEVEENSMKKMSRKYKNIAVGIAASMVILLGGGSAYAYNTPVAQVSLDVNPSITFEVNSFDRVIGVAEANSEGDALLETINWDGKKLTAVVEQTIAALKAGEYLNDEDWYLNSLLVGVNADSSDIETKLIATITRELADIVAEETNKTVDEEELGDVVVGIGAERVAEAIRLSDELDFPVTPGKLNLVQRLEASYEAIEEDMTTEQAIWLEAPVKDIMAQIKANRLAEKGITPEAVEVELTEDDTDTNGKANGNVNENANENANKIKNGNNGQSDVVRESVETDETDETEND